MLNIDSNKLVRRKSSDKRDSVRHCFLFSRILLITTRVSGGKLQLLLVSTTLSFHLFNVVLWTIQFVNVCYPSGHKFFKVSKITLEQRVNECCFSDFEQGFFCWNGKTFPIKINIPCIS